MGKNIIMEMMGKYRAKFGKLENLALKINFFGKKLNYFLPKVILSNSFLDNLK
jgi:hypothetical protein